MRLIGRRNQDAAQSRSNYFVFIGKSNKVFFAVLRNKAKQKGGKMGNKIVWMLVFISPLAWGANDKANIYTETKNRIESFQKDYPRLAKANGEPCSLKVFTDQKDDLFYIEIRLLTMQNNPLVPEFAFGRNGDIWQTVTRLQQEPYRVTVLNSSGDDHGYWSDDERTLELQSNRIKITFHDLRPELPIQDIECFGSKP